MVTVYLGVDKHGKAVCRHSVMIDTTNEINEEEVITELTGVIHRWAGSWLRYPGTTITITNLPLAAPGKEGP